jgi:hydroxymethylglutaryl-CoA synthase
MNAVNWVKSQHHKGKKALVITSDIAKYGLNSLGEPTQGAGAVAFIISDETDFVRFLPGFNAFYAKDVHDFWRPNGSPTPMVDGKYSIDCYLEALEFCTKDLQENITGEIGGKLLDFVDYFIYHLPFTRMAYKAHCKMLATLNPNLNEEQIKEIYNNSYNEKLKPALTGSEQVGNIYTGSVYMCLMSLIDEVGEKLINKNIGIFSYGSGCGAEFLIARIGQGIKKQAMQHNFKKQLLRRKKITMEQYTELYGEPDTGKSMMNNQAIAVDDEFSRYVFTGVKDHKRQYAKK